MGTTTKPRTTNSGVLVELVDATPLFRENCGHYRLLHVQQDDGGDKNQSFVLRCIVLH